MMRTEPEPRKNHKGTETQRGIQRRVRRNAEARRRRAPTLPFCPQITQIDADSHRKRKTHLSVPLPLRVSAFSWVGGSNLRYLRDPRTQYDGAIDLGQSG